MKSFSATTVVLASLFVTCTGQAFAQTAQAYPTRSIRMVIPFPAGGPTDVLARILGQKMSEGWKQPVLVENRPGANTILAAEAVAKAAPDGYTLLMAIDSTLVMNQTLISKLPYDPVKDFAPISLVATSPVIVVTDAVKGPKSIQDLLQQARANPGKLNFGGGTVATQLIGELIRRQAGIDIVYVPYKGSPGTVQGLLSNDVNFIIDGVTSSVPHVKSGKFRVLATTGSCPIAALPGTPPFATEANIPGFDVAVWLGMVAPAGTPADILGKLHQEIVRIYTFADVREKVLAAGLEPASSAPAEFADFMRKETARWTPIIKATGIKLD